MRYSKGSSFYNSGCGLYLPYCSKQLFMFNLVLFGPPGSGKGTQSDKLVAKYGLIHLSTGNLLRKEMADQTPLGLAAKSYIDSGKLVPDQVVIGMVDSFFDQHKGAKGFLFDGFPRTVAQAEALDELLTKKNTAISLVVALEVSEEELVKRLLQRGQTSGRSDDTDESVIRKRFAVYTQETSPVAAHYEQSGKFRSIAGEGSIDAIFDGICSQIETAN
jgi:adenylate kinase